MQRKMKLQQLEEETVQRGLFEFERNRSVCFLWEVRCKKLKFKIISLQQTRQSHLRAHEVHVTLQKIYLAAVFSCIQNKHPSSCLKLSVQQTSAESQWTSLCVSPAGSLRIRFPPASSASSVQLPWHESVPHRPHLRWAALVTELKIQGYNRDDVNNRIDTITIIMQ